MKDSTDIRKYISENFMKNFQGNKYLLVNVAAQRARQINDGTEVYVRSKARHSLEIALEEIKEGFIGFELGAAPEIEVEPVQDMFSFEEMIGFESDFDVEDEEPMDMEAIDLDQEAVVVEEEIPVMDDIEE